MDSLVKENQILKQQLQNYFLKVAKTQKVTFGVWKYVDKSANVCVVFQLEEEVTNIYRVHEELKQTCERREKLERAARMRLQSDLQRVQELNCVMKDQVDILQSQLLAPSEHQILIAQLFTQSKSMSTAQFWFSTNDHQNLFSDKELGAAKERQEIELAAQRATLQEQRNHIGILDTALTNAQQNIRRLEEELRKKQMCVERLNQLHSALQQTKDRKNLLDYENELAKEPNRSGSSTNSDTKWQMADKNHQMMRYVFWAHWTGLGNIDLNWLNWFHFQTVSKVSNANWKSTRCVKMWPKWRVSIKINRKIVSLPKPNKINYDIWRKCIRPNEKSAICKRTWKFWKVNWLKRIRKFVWCRKRKVNHASLNRFSRIEF